MVVGWRSKTADLPRREVWSIRDAEGPSRTGVSPTLPRQARSTYSLLRATSAWQAGQAAARGRGDDQEVRRALGRC